MPARGRSSAGAAPRSFAAQTWSRRSRRSTPASCLLPALQARGRSLSAWLAFQLASKLFDKAPVGALGDDPVGRIPYEARFAQPQRIEAYRILGVVFPPTRVGNLLQGLER